MQTRRRHTGLGVKPSPHRLPFDRLPPSNRQPSDTADRTGGESGTTLPVAGAGGRQIDFIQALRGFAALAVVMFHYRIGIAGPDYLDAGPRLFSKGGAGVDLFFVISGFIMVHTTRESEGGVRDAARFFTRRLARIWPVYVLFTFALLIAEGTLAHYTTTHDGLVALGRAFLFQPQTIDTAPWFGWAPNGVGWTLNYEVWFYLLFAVSLLAKRARWPLLIGLFLVFNVVVPVVATGVWSRHAHWNYGLEPAFLNLGASSMSLEFLGGALIGWLYHSKLRIRNRSWLVGFAVLSSVTVLCLQITEVPFNRHGITCFGLQMLVLVTALAMLDKEYPIRVPRTLIWLGDVSFSLYLVHRVVQFGFPKLLPPGMWQFGAAHVIMCLAISLALAHLSLVVLERGLSGRLQAWLLRRLPKRAVAPPATVARDDASAA